MKEFKYALLLDYYGHLLTERRRMMMEYYYNEDLTLQEIADNFDISRQAVHESIQVGRNQLMQYESRIGALDRTEEYCRLLQEISSIANNIEGTEAQKIMELCELGQDPIGLHQLMTIGIKKTI